MTDPERPSEPAGNARELTLATVAFALCFYAWSLLGPLGPDLQDQLGLSEGELALTVSIPVVLGSLMRIPLGVPSVNKWYPASRQGFALGIYGIGMGATVVGALTAPAIVNASRSRLTSATSSSSTPSPS